MPIPIETITRLAASQSDLVELGELSADGAMKVEMAIIQVLDSSQQVTLGYHLVINAYGTCKRVNNLAELVKKVLEEGLI